jgi:hypothetical protein
VSAEQQRGSERRDEQNKVIWVNDTVTAAESGRLGTCDSAGVFQVVATQTLHRVCDVEAKVGGVGASLVAAKQ